MARLARKAVTEIVSGKAETVKVTVDNLEDYLGVPKFRRSEIDDQDQIGVTTGLAWTEVGGELLNIEAVTVPSVRAGDAVYSSTGKLTRIVK